MRSFEHIQERPRLTPAVTIFRDDEGHIRGRERVTGEITFPVSSVDELESLLREAFPDGFLLLILPEYFIK